MKSKPNVTFTLNGRETTVAYDEGMHLLEVLREECGVTSPKDGCAPQGVCGCCTVLVDGRPALACLKKPHEIAGRSVVTLDGIPAPQREVLAHAFIQEGAIQCGYCTPGIMVRAFSLLERRKTDDRDAVAQGLAGHICRCTGYQRIIDAIRTAGEAWANGGIFASAQPRRHDFFGEGHGLMRGSDGHVGHGVGASESRYRGVEHAVGRKPYVADMSVPGMLHGAVVLAAHARAVVRALDTAAALAKPGVERILGAPDVPGDRHVGLIFKDWPVFVAVGETTRCVGDVLALVVADTQFHARQAAKTLVVDYEVLEPVTSPEAALENGAPAIHRAGNLLEVTAFTRGDADAALDASTHVVRRTFTTQRIEHAFLEPEACLAMPSGTGLKVYSQGQGVHDDQVQIASVLGLPPEGVEVELVSNGGAFGGKEDLSVQAQTAVAAWLLRRPVRTVLTRDQSMLLHPKRHPLTMEYAVGCDGEGRLTAVRARIVGDTGAYASVGTKVLERAAGHSCGPYRVPNVDVEARTVYTNGVCDRDVPQHSGGGGRPRRVRHPRAQRAASRRPLRDRADHDLLVRRSADARSGAADLQGERSVRRNRVRDQEHRDRQRPGGHRQGVAPRAAEGAPRGAYRVYRDGAGVVHDPPSGGSRGNGDHARGDDRRHAQ
jgi:xanthine dehydrogenase molybdenum-binding subunit